MAKQINQPDNEAEAGNRQRAGETGQGNDAGRIGDSLSGSIRTEGGGAQQGQDGNAQQAERGGAQQAMPTVPDEESDQPLSEEELRLMADTMPGEGPGDD